MNTRGNIVRLTTFGASHGSAIGGIIDGLPSNFEINWHEVQAQLNRRKPGQSAITTQRKEADEFQILSGMLEGKTTGMPLAFIFENQNKKSKDYDHLKDVYRPSHADYTYDAKYGIRDHKGGGRSSARETANWVFAGAIAQQYLKSIGVEIRAYVTQVGEVKLDNYSEFPSIDTVDQTIVRCPDTLVAQKMEDLIREVRKAGDTIGGKIHCEVRGLKAGVGNPIFDKLHAALGHAMFTINAVKGVSFGSGFDTVKMLGSEHNDEIQSDFTTKTNYSGGIQGGISNGNPIYFDIAFKPVATLMKDQNSVNKDGEEVAIEGKGRHDPCVVPRAVPIVEGMTALVLLDQILAQRLTKW